MVVIILFLFLSLLGSALFFNNKRVISISILFFFITDGFQIIPLDWMEMGNMKDFAILQSLLIFSVLVIKDKSIISMKLSRVNLGLILFFICLFVIWCVNVAILKVPLKETLISMRTVVLLIAFFFFQKLSEKEILSVKSILLFITTIQCFLFIFQIILQEQILNGFFGGGFTNIGDFKYLRCYNIPYLLPYFFFQVYFTDLVSGKLKTFLRILFLITLLLPMHRAWVLSLFIVSCYGIFLKVNSQKKFLKYMLILAVFLSPAAGFLINKFLFSQKTINDINSIASGSFDDFDYNLDGSSTLFYRFAHLYERLCYISEEKVTLLFGGGWMSENSDLARDLNFFITIYDSEKDINYMVLTPDIAWSMMFFRLGVFGVIVYMFFYGALIWYFYKWRKNLDFAIGTHLFLIFTIFTSFTSIELFTFWPMLLPALDYALSLRHDLKKHSLSAKL
ncbi:MAG: O-antigen ligase [Bacteroidales bacterium]|nr:O-antigen ligase [Bacteroidales bacterium]